jgi:hypothetical protein
MNMQVEYGLPGRGADIDANVISVRPMTLVDDGFCRVDHCHKGALFRFGSVEPIRDMSPWNDERVASRHWIFIPKGYRYLIAREYPVFRKIAERA